MRETQRQAQSALDDGQGEKKAKNCLLAALWGVVPQKD